MAVEALEMKPVRTGFATVRNERGREVLVPMHIADSMKSRGEGSILNEFKDDNEAKTYSADIAKKAAKSCCQS